MLIKINDKNLILEYTTIGGLPDSIEYNGIVSDDFEDKFKPYFYMLQDDQIIENPDYAEPTDTPPDDEPTNMQQVVMKMSATVTQMQQLIMIQEREIAELKGGTK
ncbi:DUF2977 domain-containing protein [Pediococcus pentosaceus]|uniref:DUF2977 domain-containing protein n=1 Tax=Pediococcus pentosaceus TaxID=1255 RepID=UPI00207406F4|nr:DUF2977 domain-containing protein [Pediococcus pentosaceus]MCM6793213.1 DUF2977 domain-containing protein [Pediococcus pentosaceus]